MLGRAFHDDPLWTALVPDPERRRTALATMFTALTRTVVAAGGLAETTSGFGAAALWQPPGRDIGSWAMVRSGLALPRFVIRMSRRDRGRMMGALRQIGDRRTQLMPGPHWYVPAIGVDPDHQGGGLGSALMGTGIERADRGGTPIYLETETEDNVGFYEHLGFEVLDEMVATPIDVRLWLMARRPASG